MSTFSIKQRRISSEAEWNRLAVRAVLDRRNSLGSAPSRVVLPKHLAATRKRYDICHSITDRGSRWYAGRIREGYRPHPRHWPALAELVGVAGDICKIDVIVDSG